MRWNAVQMVDSPTNRRSNAWIESVVLALWFLFVLSVDEGSGQARQNSGEVTRVVTGSVVDEATLAPLTSVLVRVEAASDSTVVISRLTESTGRFAVPDLANGVYTLRFSVIGYAPVSRTVVVDGSSAGAIRLDPIALTPQAIEVDAVEVITDRPAVIVEADRDIYSVEAMTAVAGGSATDVLESIPGVELDLEGNVTVRGERPTIYINGRPAPMRGEALAMFLEGFAAENIESVEVMANPSARYEAEGTGGIINVVLRRGVSLGVNGNTFANAGSRGELGLGGRATYVSGPITIRSGTSLRLSQNETRSSEVRENRLTDPITYLEQERVSERSNWSGNLDLTTDYAISERTEASFEVRASRNAAGTERLTNYIERDADRIVTDEYDRLIADDGAGVSADVALEVEHEFSQRGRELAFEIQYQRGRDAEDSWIRRRTLEQLGDLEFSGWDTETTWEEDRETENELRMELDYTHPFGDLLRLEIGGRTEFGSTSERRIERMDSDTGEPTPVTTLDRGFTHDLTVHSGYLTARRRVGDLNAQLGVRAEYSDYRLVLPGDQSTFGNDDFSLFPNANITYNLPAGQRLRFSYSMRVRRPSSSVLNPTNTSDDPTSRRIGNPAIEPQYTHAFNLDGSWSGRLGTLRITPSLRRSVNEWERITSVDDRGVSTTTYANLGSTTTYGGLVSVSIRNFHNFGGSLNLDAQHRISDWGAVLDRAPESMTWWSLRSNLTARVGRDLNLQTSLQYNPARDLAQGRSAATLMTRFGARHRVLDRRATLNLNITDPFNMYRPRTMLNDRSFSQAGRERPSARRVTVSVSYTFGGRGGGGGNRGTPQRGNSDGGG